MVQSSCQYDVTSRISDFIMASKVFIAETDKNFEFITEILLFLGFGVFKIPIVIENQTLVLFLERNVQWFNEF